MSTPRPPTPASARIRWSDDRGFGCVGTIGPFMFQIVRVYLDAKWMLTADGLGRAFKEREPRSDDMDELKAEAERWLEEFVTSLGAIFPGPGTALVAIEEEGRPAAFFDERDQAVIARHQANPAPAGEE